MRSLTTVLIALVAGLFLIQYGRLWTAVTDTQARTSDFAGTYAAATLWREGAPARMYDVPSEERVLAAAGTPSNHLDIPFENPPLAAVVASPFSTLDQAAAYRVWSLIQAFLLLAAVLLAVRVAPWAAGASRLLRATAAAAALAGVGTAALVLEAQWDGILVLAVAAAYALWRRDRALLAGLAIGLAAGLAKPHLAIGLLVFMLGRRDWRALAGVAAGFAAVAAFSLLATGTAGTAAFVHALLQPSNNPLAFMQGASGLTASWLGSTWAAAAVLAVLSLAAAVLAWWLGAASRRRDLLAASFSAAVVASLFLSPHLLSHDLSLLAPALVLWLAWLTRRFAAALPALASLAAWTLISLASRADLGNAAPAPPGRLTPWALGATLAAMSLVVRVARRSASPHEPHPMTPAATTAARLGDDADRPVGLEHAQLHV